VSTRRQSGVALFVALIVLVVLTLGGLGLFRSAGSGILVTGNLSFKQVATNAADIGVERARAWLLANQGALLAPTPDVDAAYYPTWDDSFDNNPAAFAGWSKASVTAPGDNQVRWVIHRMCLIPGPITAPGQSCSIAKGAGASSVRDLNSGDPSFRSSTLPYYRVTVRVDGPRQTRSLVQAMVIL
jgi:type IV pilus assembly protein PilX